MNRSFYYATTVWGEVRKRWFLVSCNAVMLRNWTLRDAKGADEGPVYFSGDGSAQTLVGQSSRSG